MFPWKILLAWGAIFGLLMVVIDIAWKKNRLAHNA
jgi:hypothetical protein